MRVSRHGQGDPHCRSPETSVGVLEGLRHLIGRKSATEACVVVLHEVVRVIPSGRGGTDGASETCAGRCGRRTGADIDTRSILSRGAKPEGSGVAEAAPHAVHQGGLARSAGADAQGFLLEWRPAVLPLVYPSGRGAFQRGGYSSRAAGVVPGGAITAWRGFIRTAVDAATTVRISRTNCSEYLGDLDWGPSVAA